MAQNYEEKQELECPKSFIKYKNDCFYHSYEKGDYNRTEFLCAEKSSKVITIKDRATYQFIRSWAIANGFYNFYLGFNYTTGDPANPIKYSDGSSFNKSVDYAFDESIEKFGSKPCTFMKKGVRYNPRDSQCEELMEPVCRWKSKSEISDLIC